MKRTLRIMVVDDEPRIRGLLSETLSESGHEVLACASAEAAQAKLNAAEFDLLFLDIHLPGMSGIDLLQQIRSRWPRLHVVVISAYATLADARRAIHLDALELLTKPFMLKDVEEAVQRCLERLQVSPPSEPPWPGVVQELPAIPLRELEARAIRAALERHRNNQTAAADELGISRRTLYNWLNATGNK